MTFSKLLDLLIILAFEVLLLCKNKEFINLNPQKILQMIYHYLLPFAVLNSTVYSIYMGEDLNIVRDVLFISAFNWDSIPPPIAIAYGFCVVYSIKTIVAIFGS